MEHWSIPRTAALAGAVVLAVEALLLATGNSAVLHGVLFDPDCYMHLARSLRLLIEGGWHETLDPRINAPFGAALHWTALFDMLLFAGAAPLNAMGIDPHSALYIWGSAISPTLLAAALAIFAWGVRPRLSGLGFLWLVILLFTQPQLSGAFIAGRPDHHSLVLGLMLAQIAWIYARFDGRAGSRSAIAAGVVAGLQLSTSVEALLTILVLSATLAAAWLIYGRRTLRDLALYLGAAVVTVLAWLLWERGTFLVTPAYDRVSIAHVVPLASGALGLAGVMLAERWGLLASATRKLLALGVAALFATIAVLTTYPDFFLGPWPRLDPVIVEWHRQISELQPLMPLSLNGLAAFLAQMTAPVLSLPLIIHRLRRGSENDRPVMLLSLLGFLVFGGLSLDQMRWAGEAQAVTLLPWTLTTIAIWKSDAALQLFRSRIPLRALVLGGALLLQVVPAAWTQKQSRSVNQAAACDWSGAARVLATSVPDNAIVMAPVWYGPEILWRSNLRVVGGPYEIAPAMRDTAAFLHGSEAAARAVAGNRGITHVLVCSHDNWPGFGGELAVGRHPAWLVPAPLKNGPKELRLYRLR